VTNNRSEFCKRDTLGLLIYKSTQNTWNIQYGGHFPRWLPNISYTIKRNMTETQCWYLSLYVLGPQGQWTQSKCYMLRTNLKWHFFSKWPPYTFQIFINIRTKKFRDTILMSIPIYFRSTTSMDTITISFVKISIKIAAFFLNGRLILVKYSNYFTKNDKDPIWVYIPIHFRSTESMDTIKWPYYNH
jgi:hypothetical protein